MSPISWNFDFLFRNFERILQSPLISPAISFLSIPRILSNGLSLIYKSNS